ncbi:hypothetical protein HDG38_003384 [Paraburkholderia sp. WSM4177]|nr:hypothetical protein [Paraburkholderia sp. WSM4177]MBB5484886.1 hypothetical protein [Paraburkholderia sp. WSM4180]
MKRGYGHPDLADINAGGELRFAENLTPRESNR